jgi:hypothetical protein
VVQEVLAKTPLITASVADGAAVTTESSEAAKVNDALDANDGPDEAANAAAELVISPCVAVNAAVAMVFRAVKSVSPAASACAADVASACAADVMSASAADVASACAADVVATDPKIESNDELMADASALANVVNASRSAFRMSMLLVEAAAKAELKSVASANLVTVEVFPAAMSAKVNVCVEEVAVTAP